MTATPRINRLTPTQAIASNAFRISQLSFCQKYLPSRLENARDGDFLQPFPEFPGHALAEGAKRFEGTFDENHTVYGALPRFFFVTGYTDNYHIVLLAV